MRSSWRSPGTPPRRAADDGRHRGRAGPVPEPRESPENDTGPGYGKIFIMKQLNIGGGRISPVGSTPFLMAALSFDPALMRILVAAGADPLLANEENVTPLMAAIGLGRERASLISYKEEQEPKVLEMVKLTVELGVDVNAQNTDGRTALDSAKTLRFDSVAAFLTEKGAKPGTPRGKLPEPAPER